MGEVPADRSSVSSSVAFPRVSLGYCTNVHAGHDLASTIANLRMYAAEVRRQLNVPELGIGLWLSAEAAREAVGGERPEDAMKWGVSQKELSCHSRFRDELGSLGLRVFTLNGFPYSNFHEPAVKHRVYEPNWADPRRLEYTLDLIAVLASLLDEGEEGSISTLPIGWPKTPCRRVDMHAAGVQLRHVARALERLERETGKLIHVDLEPEPGCIIGSAAEAVEVLRGTLLTDDAGEDAVTQRYLRICHDVCHAAVVFEGQMAAMDRYRASGWQVGKVQVSSAPCVRFDEMPASERRLAWEELMRFVEPRYLHQTCVKTDEVRAYQDLPEAIAAWEAEGDSEPGGEWRVHYHVPVYLNRIGMLGTSQGQIVECLKQAMAIGVRHYEVETYAWTVLPKDVAPVDLATGIADELRWVNGLGVLNGGTSPQ